MASAPQFLDYLEDHLSVVVLGASGDLAKKKTYPSLMDLDMAGMLPEASVIVGFARSAKADEEFRESLRPYLRKRDDGKRSDFEARMERFLARCFYRRGQYDDATTFATVSEEMAGWEASSGKARASRVFYFALPPNVFLSSASAIKSSMLTSTGFNRLIVEKPFGHDYASAEELATRLGELHPEDRLYRIDHYLGKEMVQNLMAMRFGNMLFAPVWHRNFINTVQITFKEDFGTEGRGGYFAPAGIIRDIMQNHLMQVLTLVAMEPPVRISGEGSSNLLRDAKVAVLNCMEPLRPEDVVLGQYVAADGHPGFLDDETVPRGAKTPTFATAVFRINNPRWEGVPFIMKAGKALDERKAEIRIQFKRAPAAHHLFDGAPIAHNELVMRLQPNEAVYVKMNIKGPGLRTAPEQSELDLNYKTRYPNEWNPDAYTRLLLDVLRGNQSTFVRTDELLASWRIFSPVLEQFEREGTEPLPYPYGSRGPAESDEFIRRLGYSRDTGYVWAGGK